MRQGGRNSAREGVEVGQEGVEQCKRRIRGETRGGGTSAREEIEGDKRGRNSGREGLKGGRWWRSRCNRVMKDESPRETVVGEAEVEEK